MNELHFSNFFFFLYAQFFLHLHRRETTQETISSSISFRPLLCTLLPSPKMKGKGKASSFTEKEETIVDPSTIGLASLHRR